MGLYHLLDNIESQSGSSNASRSFTLDPVEFLEKVWNLILRNAKAPVLYGNNHEAILQVRRSRNGDFVVRPGILNGIRDQVVQDLVEPQLVGSDLWKAGRQVLLETAFVLVNGYHVLHRINDVQIFKVEFDDSGLNL